MSYNKNHSFWGSVSPLGGLTGAGLLVMGSARLSWAITVCGSLFWVYGLTALSYVFLSSALGKKIFPSTGIKTVYVCLASFWGSIYIFMFWILCPFAVLEVFLLLLLVPLFCAESGIIKQLTSVPDNSYNDIFEYVSEAVSQAGVLIGLLIAMSIIREPLSYCSLSFPGTYQGMITIMYFRASSFFPIRIFTSSSGALLFLGYIMSIYQYSKMVIFPGENR